MKGRGGGRGRQGGGKTLSRPAKVSPPVESPEAGSSSEKGKPRSELACRDRYLEALLQLVGQTVVVERKDGTIVNGLFHCVGPSTNNFPFNFVLKASSEKTSTGEKKSTSAYQTTIISASDVIQVKVPSVVLGSRGAGGFATDTDISSGSAAHLMNRELKSVDGAWLASEYALGDLENDEEGTEQWDQFEANRKITGRLATFNEEDYTTKLDMSKVNLQAPGAEEIAAKLAAEIEGDASDASNIHVAEERGQVVDTQGLDEEDLYSGVVRTTAKQETVKPVEEIKPEDIDDGPRKGPNHKLSAAAKEFTFNPKATTFVPKNSPPLPVTPAEPTPATASQAMPMQPPQDPLYATATNYPYPNAAMMAQAGYHQQQMPFGYAAGQNARGVPAVMMQQFSNAAYQSQMMQHQQMHPQHFATMNSPAYYPGTASYSMGTYGAAQLMESGMAADDNAANGKGNKPRKGQKGNPKPKQGQPRGPPALRADE